MDTNRNQVQAVDNGSTSTVLSNKTLLKLVAEPSAFDVTCLWLIDTIYLLVFPPINTTIVNELIFEMFQMSPIACGRFAFCG